MRDKSYTQLSLILDHLFIKSKDIAAAIHVDAAMISRWRTGKRVLNNRTEHYAHIIDFILDWDERMNYQNIIVFLMDYYPDSTYKTREDVYNAVDMWLSDINTASSASSGTALTSSQSSSIQMNILDTTAQKKNAMLYLLDVAISLSDNRDLYILMDAFADKLLNEETFYSNWIERLKLAAARGINVHFIYSSYFLSSSIIDMNNFLKLCFSQNFHAYYMPKSSGYPIMLCVLDGSFAISNFVHIPNEKNPAYFSFSDKKLLYRFRHYYKEQLKNCQLFTKYYNYPDYFFDHTDFSADSERKLCCYDATPFLFPVPPEIFEEILEYNAFDEKTKSLIMDRYRAIIYDPFMTANNVFTHNLIIDINEMERVLGNAKQITMCRILTDREIIIPRKYFAVYISYIHDFIKEQMNSDHPPFDIFLITDTNASLPRDASIYTMGGLFAHIYSYPMNRYMMITNPSIAADIYIYMKKIWDELPEENHYTKSSLLLLKKLLDTVT